ncbi:MAG: oxaloacetate decarboxylase subunit alpha [Eubacteriales bacterium]
MSKKQNQIIKPVKITDTILRDAHQSLIATRMRIEDMLPIIDKLDKVGYHSIECWGGATFDACLRFLKEDPWKRLRKLRNGFKNTKLQMLLRGQNLLGYHPYPDDVVEYFVQKAIANGIDIIRIFDSLNDTRNLKTAIEATNKEGGHAQVAISYTLSKVHTLDYYVKLAKELEDLGANSICIKDMAGLLVPYEASKLISAFKETVKLPIQLHTHYSSGVASMTYLKGVEAGVDIIDTAVSPFSMGTSQPATEVMVETFKGTPYDTGLDLDLLAEIADYFRPLRDEALDSGLLNPKVLGVNIKTLLYQVPGGMLSNLVSQLKEQNAEERFYEVLEEIPKVRADYGYPPLVTPSSQIVGTQAVLNVLMGERYKLVTKESKALVRGEYGRMPVPISKDIKKKIIGNEKQITCRPADLLESQLEKVESEMKQYKQQDEDVLSYILFKQPAEDYFKYRQAQKTKIDPNLIDEDNKIYPA